MRFLWYFISLIFLLGTNRVLSTPQHYIPDSEYNALYQLYESTHGSTWAWDTDYVLVGYPWNFTNSLFSNPCNETYPWQGLYCTRPCNETYCHIETFLLSSYNLTGTLPSEIGDFPQLTQLDMDSNHLSGSLPPTIANLTQLKYLNVRKNSFSKSIPNEITNLRQIKSIDLDSNSFTGTIPVEIGKLSFLTDLDLSSNKLTGTIPYSIGNLTSLLYLELNNNMLIGKIPHSIGNLIELVNLFLYSNSLTGTIPIEISNLVKVTELYLYTNQLTGSIPESIGNLSALQYLDIAINRLNGTLPQSIGNLTSLIYVYLYNNELSGSIPDSIGNLKFLQVLSVEFNSFTGLLPASIGNLSSLYTLYVYYTSISGPIPETICKLSSSLLYALLFENQFTGTIPSCFGSLSSLHTLQIDTNFLTGTIPKELGQLSSVGTITLYDNLLTGTIPPELGNMTSLITLYFFDNQFTGTLPVELGKLINLNSMDIESNLLSGTIPSVYCNMTNLYYLYLSTNRLSGTLTHCLFENPNLQQIDLFSNFISGTFPAKAELSKFPGLFAFDMSHNYLEGSLPRNLMTIPYLQYFAISYNYFTGALPSDILVNPGNLRYFEVDENYFTSTLPSAQFTRADKFEYLDFSNNLLTGSYPSSIYKDYLQNLLFINIANNYLTGPLPSKIGGPSLRVLYLQNNSFTGSISDELITENDLHIFMASLNCLTGTIPETFCQHSNLSQLILDGLHSSKGCIRKLFSFDSKSSYALSNGVHGTIPSCLFGLPALQVLHLSGNNLHGNLPSTISISTVLSSLILANNLLTGRIPDWLWEQNQLIYLDLSFNLFVESNSMNSSNFFSGNRLAIIEELYSDLGTNLSYLVNPTLKLQVNHISGRLPTTWTQEENNFSFPVTINILEGNLYDCNLDRSDLPKQDPNRDSYQCGSIYTNYSLYIALGIFFTFLGLILYVFHRREELFRFFEMVWHVGKENNLRLVSMKNGPFANRPTSIQSPHISTENNEMNHIPEKEGWRTFTSSNAVISTYISTSGLELSNFLIISQQLTFLVRFLLVLVFWVFVVIMAAYISLSSVHGTYIYQYVWVLSSAYLSGKTAAVIMLVLFLCITFGLILFLTYYLTPNVIYIDRFLFNVCNCKIFKGGDEKKISGEGYISQENVLFVLKMILFLLFDGFVVLIVNFSYVLALNHGYNDVSITFISLAVTLFKLVWSNVFLLGQGRLYLEQSLGFQLHTVHVILLSIFNNVLAPYLAEAFVSSNCFLYAITNAPDVNTVYFSLFCYPTYICSVVYYPSTKSYNTQCEFEVQCDNVASYFNASTLSSAISTNTLNSRLLSNSYTPPFHYNYTCSSSLLSAFVYIFVYRYIFTTFCEPLLFFLLKYIQINSSYVYEKLSLRIISFGKLKDSQELFTLVTNILPTLLRFYQPRKALFSHSFDKKVKSSTDQQEDVSLSPIDNIEESQMQFSLTSLENTLPMIVSPGEKSIVRLTTDIVLFLSFGVMFPPLALLIFISLLKDITLEQFWLAKLFSSYLGYQGGIPTHSQAKLREILELLDGKYEVWVANIWNGLWWSGLVGVWFWSFCLYDTLAVKEGPLQSIWIILVLALSPLWIHWLVMVFHLWFQKFFLINSNSNNNVNSIIHNKKNNLSENVEERLTEMAITPAVSVDRRLTNTLDTTIINDIKNNNNNITNSSEITIENPLQRTLTSVEPEV